MKTYQAMMDTLEQHFDPNRWKLRENLRFKCRRQGDTDASSPDENIDEYLVALRRIARNSAQGTGQIGIGKIAYESESQ